MRVKDAWYMRAQNIGKPAIYLVLVAVFVIPLVRPLGLPLNVSDNTRKAYEIIDAIPSGSYVFHTIGFNPAVDAETWPQMAAISRHYMEKGLRVIYFPTFQEGGMYAQRVRDSIAPEYGYEYGIDFAILPFKAGGETAIAGLKDFYSQFAVDAYGTPLKDLPVFSEFGGMADVAAAIPVTGGDDFVQFVKYIESAFKTPIIVCGTAPVLPVAGPYLASGQIKGAVIGLSGAAEYEVLAGVPGKATGAMDAQAMGHLLIVGLVLLGNIGFFFQKRLEAVKGGA
ncbi:MAG: hypothetical protein ACOX5M_04440 [Bacillota bacterium]|jgi:hypothetical protein